MKRSLSEIRSLLDWAKSFRVASGQLKSMLKQTPDIPMFGRYGRDSISPALRLRKRIIYANSMATLFALLHDYARGKLTYSELRRPLNRCLDALGYDRNPNENQGRRP